MIKGVTAHAHLGPMWYILFRAFRGLISAKPVTGQVLCLDTLYTKVALVKFLCYLWLVTKKKSYYGAITVKNTTTDA